MARAYTLRAIRVIHRSSNDGSTNSIVNTFQHVVDCLRKIIPGMSEDKAWTLANKIDGEGAAEVWCGPLEQAELYHQQLGSEGLTMAPIERC